MLRWMCGRWCIISLNTFSFIRIVLMYNFHVNDKKKHLPALTCIQLPCDRDTMFSDFTFGMDRNSPHFEIQYHICCIRVIRRFTWTYVGNTYRPVKPCVSNEIIVRWIKKRSHKYQQKKCNQFYMEKTTVIKFNAKRFALIVLMKSLVAFINIVFFFK